MRHRLHVVGKHSVRERLRLAYVLLPVTDSRNDINRLEANEVDEIADVVLQLPPTATVDILMKALDVFVAKSYGVLDSDDVRGDAVPPLWPPFCSSTTSATIAQNDSGLL